ncbi:MAG TPA: rhomboid family intramembrane serine protease [Thermoleophilaceae bacterium]|nr:rhomboid family intramembrane serine protease [Thermoleophilaceae bacterium]
MTSPSVHDDALTRREDRQMGVAFVAILVALMWVLEIYDQATGESLDQYGIEPHDVDGLGGIFLAPFLHAGFGHLIGNTVPFVLLGFTIALGGILRVAATTLIVIVVGGLGTWLIAPTGTDHIGASGVVFGYATYLIARGLYSRRPLHLGIGLVVLGVYGSTLLFGLVPRDGISWQGHLCGGIGGIVAARLLDRRAARAAAPEPGYG